MTTKNRKRIIRRREAKDLQALLTVEQAVGELKKTIHFLRVASKKATSRPLNLSLWKMKKDAEALMHQIQTEHTFLHKRIEEFEYES